MQIKKMTIADYAGVYQLWLDTPGMGLNTVDDSEDGIAKYLRRNPETCFVAEKDGEIVGVILVGHDGRRGYIHHMAVKVSERAQGIGTMLLDVSMAALKNEGISKVISIVFKYNEIGNEYWENRGYAVREDLVYRDKLLVEMERIDT